ncbi:hypothetical protein PHYBLDRAFT_187133, partial [Phycomyces blakesleeanus NRRL 1555(-)]
MLQELEILNDGSLCRVEFGIDDFDNMHQSLQNLSSIKAIIHLSFDFSAMLDAIPNTTPALSVTSLDINSKLFENKTYYINGNMNYWNPLWMYYFGYKYPNLRSLKLNATNIVEIPIIPGKRETTRSLFRSNPKAFQHLETFSLTTDRYFESFDLILWEVLCRLKVSLKHLTLNAAIWNEIDDSYPMDVNRILQSFSEKLESLLLTGFMYNAFNEDTILEFSYYYPFLTNLCISGESVLLDLDNLLEKCVALKQLKLCGEDLYLDPYTTTENPDLEQHGLEILTLGSCFTSAETLNRISFRCRSLKHLTLSI